jgi:outer membrane protein assembly factor BamE
MLEIHRRSVHLTLIASCCLGLAGCSSISDPTSKMLKAVTPYKIDVVQGNVVTREQLASLKPGMERNAVREVLGTPLLTSMFHADRWDYVFTLRRQGLPSQSRKVTLYFKGDVLDRTEAEALPSESEFVSTLKSDTKTGSLPVMQATDESLKKFPAPAKPAQPAPVTAAPTEYPPLESAGK